MGAMRDGYVPPRKLPLRQDPAHARTSVRVVGLVLGLLSIPPGVQAGPWGARYPIKLNGRYGYIDARGVVVVKARYEAVEPFSEGLAAVKYRGRWGYIDRSGRMVVPLRPLGCDDGRPIERRAVGSEFRDVPAGPFRHGRALLCRSARDAGFIDRRGRIVAGPFHYAESFSDARALACRTTNGRQACGYIAVDGRVRIKLRYRRARSFAGGLAAVLRAGKWGFIDAAGREVIAPRFLEVGDFSEGLAPVAVAANGGWGYVDRKGVMRVRPMFRAAGSFAGGVAAATYKPMTHFRWALIDKAGHPLSQRRYRRLSVSSLGVVGCSEAGCKVIDTRGRSAYQGRYAYMHPLDGPLDFARTTRHWGYVDRRGEWVWKSAETRPMAKATSRGIGALAALAGGSAGKGSRGLGARSPSLPDRFSPGIRGGSTRAVGGLTRESLLRLIAKAERARLHPSGSTYNLHRGGPKHPARHYQAIADTCKLRRVDEIACTYRECAEGCFEEILNIRLRRKKGVWSVTRFKFDWNDHHHGCGTCY